MKIDTRIRFSDCIVGDIEASLDKNNSWVFKIGVLYDGHTFSVFDTPLEMFIGMSGRVVYFHNLSFDLMFFIKEKCVIEGVVDGRFLTSGSSIVSITIKTVEFRDSLVLLSMPLAQVVEKFLGINDNEYLNNKKNVLELQRPVLIEYCKKDCKYLHMALLKFFELVNEYVPGTPLTAPSATLKIFRKRFLSSIEKKFLNQSSRNEFFDKDYYFGGHTEKFHNGVYVRRNVYYYDVNSLYPFIMKDLCFSLGKLREKKPILTSLKRLLDSGKPFFCECVVEIKTEEMRFFPCLIEGRNRYRFGIQRIKMSEIGLRFIVDFGGWESIKRVERIFIGRSDETIYPFRDFVTDFYAKRSSGNGGENIVYKLFLNSLYGKFGERLEREVMVLNNTQIAGIPLSEKRLPHGVFVSKHIEMAPFYKKRFNRLDIAGKTTEGGRLYMGRIINMIRSKGGNVFYTDTDSIITDFCLEEHGHSWLGNGLGFLKNEFGYGNKDSVYLIGCKMYGFRKTLKMATKGFRTLTIEDFREIIRNRKLLKERKQFSKFSKYVSKGFFGIMETPIELTNFIERLD